MPPNRPSVSPGETEVLKAIWAIEKGSVGEIFAAIEKDLDYTTVQTYVRRLEAKGFIEATRIGRNKIYRAAIAQEEVVEEAVDEFVQLHFDGQLLPMIRHLVDHREITKEEINDLMKIVRALKAEKGDGKNAR